MKSRIFVLLAMAGTLFQPAFDERLLVAAQTTPTPAAGTRRPAGISPEERQKIELALPASAPTKPKKARKLLVFDLNVGRGGHPSIPYANLAMQLMGQKTGAFEATASSDPAILEPARLREFDAVYFNNSIGNIFKTTEARDHFAEFVRNGGGVMGNHGATVTMPDWEEFGRILGARGASHRMIDERAVVNVEDPDNPLVKAFGDAPFEFVDEFFRFQAPYSRDKVRVLMSLDAVKTNFNQGRCYGQCYRDDNDYPVAWIHTYGKGRVFYTGLGHNADVFLDPRVLQMFLAAAQYVMGDLDADATPRPRADMLERVLPAVTQYDWGQDEAPARQLERAMGFVGAGSQAARAAEQKLLAALGNASRLGAKDVIVRQLAIVGSSASVPALGRLLDDRATAEIARYALERIDSADATAALRRALVKAPDARTKTGLIHSLARRKDAESVAELRKLLSDRDVTVGAAAVNALGMIGTAEAEAALLSIKVTPAVGDALLTVAQQAPAARALPIYRKLFATGNADELRVAALHGLARGSANDVVAQALRDSSPNVQSAAIDHLPAQALLAAAGKLPPAQTIQALTALSLRGDASAAPAFRAALKHEAPQVRIAALQALATRATAEDIPALVTIAASASGDEQEAARSALNRAPGLDSALASALATAQSQQKLELIRAAGERGNQAVSDAILASARDSDPNVRRAALRALRGLARPEQSETILQMLLSSDQDRDDLQRALAAAVGRSEQRSIAPLVQAFDNTADTQKRASLLAVIASTGEKEALPVLRKALETSDPVIQRAGITGLSEWTSTEPLDDLLKVAGTSSDPALKALALRGYIRLLQRPMGRPPAETAKLLGAAMAAASRPEEKRAVLAALQRVVSPESLAIAKAAENDPAVAAEAKLAVATLDRALAGRTR